MKGGRGREKLDSEEYKSSEESDLEEDEFWYTFACLHETFSVFSQFNLGNVIIVFEVFNERMMTCWTGFGIS